MSKRKQRSAGSLSQCLGKVRYATLEYAEKKVAVVSKKFNKAMRTYYCGICGGYHLTSKERQ